jgi:hypothetical protein
MDERPVFGRRQPQPCSCGSGLLRHPLNDAAGIFLRYVCDKCESEVKASLNPRVFDTSSRYARSGEEIDL